MSELTLRINPLKAILSFNQLRNIIRSFNLLTEVVVGNNYKYIYKGSKKRCKLIAIFHAISSNWYVNVSYINKREKLRGKLNKRNYVNISFYSEEELRLLLEMVIKSFN